MKNIYTILISVLAFGSMSVQANQFEGASIGLGLGYVQPKIVYTDGNPPGKYVWNNESLVGQLDVSYSLALDDKWFVGYGLTYDLNSTRAGAENEAYGPVAAFMKDHRSVYFQPGYAIDNSSAIFGKIGYHEARLNALGKSGAGWIDDKFTIRGFGYGLGYKKLMNENFFVQAEIQYVNYKDKNLGGGSWHYKQQSNAAIFTVGYKF